MRVPWRDRHGRFLPLKAAALPLCFVPGLWLIFRLAIGDFGARPITELIHGTGDWAVRFLMISLAITPFARLCEWPRLLTIRRMAGLTALSYVVLHFALYVVDEKFHFLTVATEIALRFYLTIGFVALAGLIALGVTSTDAAIRRMGPRWKQLHRAVYPIGVLALLHFYIQTKANVGQPVFVSGLFIWLMVWRLLPPARRMAPAALFALAPVAAAATMGLEFAWYGLATRIDPSRVLAANWNERFFPRPAHWVGIVALGVAAGLSLWRAWRGRARRMAPAR